MFMPWRLRKALQPLRQRGLGNAAALLQQLPAAVLLRAWRRAARPLNRSLFGRWSNSPRLAQFQGRLPAGAQPRLYVIVMPHVLHFLLPCLALLRGQAQLVLLANGAKAWELKSLQQHLPEAPLFKLHCLPGSSVEHGDVLSLLIEHQRGCFGIVDHDCYLFDRTILQRLQPAADECLLTLFSDRHPHTGIDLPLTHFLFVNAPLLQALGREHGVDARLYRHAPRSTQQAFERLGLAPDTYLKPHQLFHDTLHVLLVLALARGQRVRLLQVQGELPFAHVGGTSMGSHHTKGLFALHTHLRFLELLGSAELKRRYGFITRPLLTAGQTLALRRDDDRAWDGLPLLERMIHRLASALHQAWPQRYPADPVNSTSPR